MSFIYASYCESMLYIYTYIYIHYPGLNLAYNYKQFIVNGDYKLQKFEFNWGNL